MIFLKYPKDHDPKRRGVLTCQPLVWNLVEMERNREFSLGCGGGVGDRSSVLCVHFEDSVKGISKEDNSLILDLAEDLQKLR